MKHKAQSYVYCIQEQSRDAFAPIKVGIARNVEQRLENLQVGNPQTLMLRGSIGPLTRGMATRTEADLMAAMSPHRIRGEWFSGRALEVFEQLQVAHGWDGYKPVLARSLSSVGNGQEPVSIRAQDMANSGTDPH